MLGKISIDANNVPLKWNLASPCLQNCYHGSNSKQQETLPSKKQTKKQKELSSSGTEGTAVQSATAGHCRGWGYVTTEEGTGSETATLLTTGYINLYKQWCITSPHISLKSFRLKNLLIFGFVHEHAAHSQHFCETTRSLLGPVLSAFPTPAQFILDLRGELHLGHSVCRFNSWPNHRSAQTCDWCQLTGPDQWPWL